MFVWFFYYFWKNRLKKWSGYCNCCLVSRRLSLKRHYPNPYYFQSSFFLQVRWSTVIFAWLVRVWASKDTIRYRTIYTAVLIWFWIFWIFLLFLKKSLKWFWLGYCNCCLVHVWVSRDTTSLRTIFKAFSFTSSLGYGNFCLISLRLSLKRHYHLR